MIYSHIFLVVVFIFSLECSHADPKSYCLSNDTNPYTYSGIISSYEQIRSTAGSESICKPVQIWSLNRHGTRYPTLAEITLMRDAGQTRDKIVEFYSSGQNLPSDALCENDIAKLKAWKWNSLIDATPYTLTEQGWAELKEIAQRYKSRYPIIFNGKYSPEDYTFRHTAENRTEDSCHAFVEGLFGKDADEVHIEAPQEPDDVLRPYKTCEAWNFRVSNSPNRLFEANNFRKSKVFVNMINDVSKRLGFSAALTSNELEVMYNNCRFEKTWFPNEVSAWCSVFHKKELVYLEYLDDLVMYYKSGHGHWYNKQLGCKPLENLVQTFEKTIHSKEAKPKAIHYFSHDTIINMILTAMDVSEDQEKLSGENYENFLINRLYRSSLNIPFASNIAAVLHQCSRDVDPYEVQFFLNERPMEIKGCNHGLCTWNFIKDHFGSMLPCNLHFCSAD